MQANFVVIAQRCRDAALRVLGVRLRDLLFGKTQNAPRRRKLHRSSQARDSCAYYDEVGLVGKVFHGDERNAAECCRITLSNADGTTHKRYGSRGNSVDCPIATTLITATGID